VSSESLLQWEIILKKERILSGNSTKIKRANT